MTPDERQDYNEFMEDYPNLEPCCDCYYWRDSNEGKPYVKGTRRSRAFSIGTTFSGPCCYYSLETYKPRIGHPKNGKCDCFKKR